MQKWFSLIIVIIGFISINACDSLIPEDFSKKNYKIDESDAIACTKLSRPLYSRDTNNVIIDTNFVSLQLSRYDLLFDSTTIASNSEGQNISGNYQSLLNTLSVIQLDTMVNASFAWDRDKEDAVPVYFAVIDAIPGRYVIYISWQLNEKNKDGFVETDLVNSDSTFSKKDTQIKLASMECFESATSSSGDAILFPKLHGRFELDVPSKSLVRFELPSPLVFKKKSSDDYDTFQILVLKAE